MFLESTSISPACNAVNLSFALKGVYFTLLASPKTAAATALQTSTSIPVHFPLSSALEKPGRPCETPHFTKPCFFVASTVLAFFPPSPHEVRIKAKTEILQIVLIKFFIVPLLI